MKILEVNADDRRHRFELRTQAGGHAFPYIEADPPPSSTDPVVEVWADPELGSEAFTYRLESGAEGSVHIDAVLEYEARFDPGRGTP